MDEQDHTNVGERTSPTFTNRGWVSIKQLATLFERDYRTVRKWVDEGRIRSIKVGGQYRIMEEEVRYVLENGTRAPGEGENNDA